MSKLDDLFGSSEEEHSPLDGFDIELDMSISCPVCGGYPDGAFYNKNKKKVEIVCVDGEEPHTTRVDLDLSFIYG